MLGLLHLADVGAVGDGGMLKGIPPFGLSVSLCQGANLKTVPQSSKQLPLPPPCVLP